MLSSRSTSPTPSSSKGGGGSEESGGGAASLSNDALYTPLSSLHADQPLNNDQTQSKKKGRHSLSLQTSSSLRESSLVTFLTSMGNSMKTSHPHESLVYRGLGGSIGRYGTGDGGRVDKAMRNTMESKLSNRSLVLVGGGIHTYTATTSSTMTISGGGGRGDAKSGGGVARSNKRKRKRVGGNGVFGCKSRRQRKKAMDNVMETDTQSSEHVTTLTIDELGEEVGNIVEKLHKMWTKYIQQNLNLSQLKTKNRADAASIPLESRKEIATILATSEHVGMAATIVACPSRRHLVQQRCIVLNETKETYKIAIRKSRPAQAQKKEAATRDADATCTKLYQWKVVIIPKNGTSLYISVPWSSSSDRITVRLET